MNLFVRTIDLYEVSINLKLFKKSRLRSYRLTSESISKVRKILLEHIRVRNFEKFSKPKFENPFTSTVVKICHTN